MRIRWMIKRDVAEVLEIERLAFGDDAWSESQIIHVLRESSTVGSVIESDNCVVGFVIYEVFKDKIFLRRIAVHPDNAMQNLGTELINKLKKNLGLKRSIIKTIALENNLVAHKFLRRCGFVCVGIIKNPFAVGEDGYAFIFDGHPARRTDAAFARYSG